MPDFADMATTTKSFTCQYCFNKFEDMDPNVAFQIKENHERKCPNKPKSS